MDAFGWIFLILAIIALFFTATLGIREEKERGEKLEFKEIDWDAVREAQERADYIRRVNLGFARMRRKYKRIDYDLSEGLVLKPDDLEWGLYDPNTRFGECDSVVDRKHSTICSRTGDGHIYIIR